MKKEKILEFLEDSRITKEFMERDLVALGIKKGYSVISVDTEEFEEMFNEEFPAYDGDVYLGTSNPDNIIILHGQDVEHKDVNLVYYAYNAHSKGGNVVSRQLRRYNYKGELEKINRATLNSNGEYLELDEGTIKYEYDENGIKKYSKIENQFSGDEYIIYNENGIEEIRITKEYIDQLVIDGDKQYHIIDGFIMPASKDSDFLFRYIPSKEDLGLNDIKRVVYGNISEEEKDLIIADLDDERKKQILETLDLKYHLEWILQDIDEELEYSDELILTETDEPGPVEIVEESIKECVENLRESGIPYTFEKFIKDTKSKVFGEKRPMVICKDGTEYSIQASSNHYCFPREDGLEEYEEFEIGNIKNWEIDDLAQYAYYDENIASFVPKEVVEKIIKEHGGLNRKVMKQRVEEHKKIFEPKDEAYEKMIKDMFGDNEFFANIFRYASRKCDLSKKEGEAQELLEAYEEELDVSDESYDIEDGEW